jgi:hypothetical protein
MGSLARLLDFTFEAVDVGCRTLKNVRLVLGEVRSATPTGSSPHPSPPPVRRARADWPPGPAGACHRAGQRPDPLGRPDDKLRVIRAPENERRITPEPAIGPRFAPTRWANPHCVHAGECGRERKTRSALMGMPTQRRNRACAIFIGNGFDRRHGASLHIFACRPLVWSADCLDAMLRLSPRGEIAPPWRDINERTPCAVKAQCTRCRAQNDALRADFDRFESHTGVVAGLVPPTPSLKALRVGWAKSPASTQDMAHWPRATLRPSLPSPASGGG